MAMNNSSKTHQKACIISVFFILVALLLCSIFGHLSSTSKQKEKVLSVKKPPTAIQHPIIRSVCSRTFYPSLCFNTLSPVSASRNSTTFLRILEIAIKSSEKSVAKTRTQVKKLLSFQDSISRLKIVLRDCLDMLDQTVEELSQALDDLGSIGNLDSLYANLKTLLSASMTNQHTCLDGFSDLNYQSRASNYQIHLENRIRDSLIPVIRSISNCLSIVTYMERRNQGRAFHARQMFAKIPQRRNFPHWMKSTHRVLIETKAKFRQNLTVARDGSGDYRLISEALKKAPTRSKNPFVIKIKAGVYNETVEISREKTNIMLIGDGMSKTVITGSKNIIDGFSTIDSATLTVSGDRFVARDLTILNTAGPHKYQAVAARVTANSAFYRCNFSSYQDTLFAHSLQQFYHECTIQGTIDFIFGNAAAIFRNCLILVRKPIHGQSNMITAQGRRDPNQTTGFSLQNCTIMAAEELNATKGRNFSTFLGRPWGNYSRTMVMGSYLGGLIHPQGWHKWDDFSNLETVEYIEHMNYGPGADTRHRVNWGGYKKNCSREVVRHFMVGEFLQDAGAWLESTGFPLNEV